MLRNAVLARLWVGGLVGDTLIGIGPDLGDAVRDGWLVGIVSRHDGAAGDDFLALRPDHPEPRELAAGAARDVDRGAQQKRAIGDFLADRVMRPSPDHGLALEPGIQGRSVVVLAITP